MTAFPDRKFWMVYGIGQGAPRMHHPSLEAAAGEAKRLARAVPGVTFVVLEAVGAAVKSDLQMRSYGTASGEPDPFLTDDQIPF